MKRERIERLAIDCAAGELNEDAQVLFKAYLAEHPDAQEWSSDMLDIYQKTQAVIDTKTKDGHAGPEKTFIGKNRLLQINWRRLARWAAVVVFASLIGFTAGRWDTTEQTNRISLHQPRWNPEQVRTVSDLREKYEGTFWGDKMLALLESKPVQRSKSNFKDGGFWDKYKQYKGEQF